jgi:hypothetical protein
MTAYPYLGSNHVIVHRCCLVCFSAVPRHPMVHRAGQRHMITLHRPTGTGLTYLGALGERYKSRPRFPSPNYSVPITKVRIVNEAGVSGREMAG